MDDNGFHCRVSYLCSFAQQWDFNGRLKVVAQLSQLQGPADGFSCSWNVRQICGNGRVYLSPVVANGCNMHRSCVRQLRYVKIGDRWSLLERQDPPDPARVYLDPWIMSASSRARRIVESQFSFTAILPYWSLLMFTIFFGQQTQWKTMEKWFLFVQHTSCWWSGR